MYIVFLRILFQLSPFFRFFFFFIVNILIFYLFNFCMAEEPPRGSYTIKYVCMHVSMYVFASYMFGDTTINDSFYEPRWMQDGF